MIELKNIVVNFDTGKGAVDAVQNVSLSIKEGEIFGIVGSSGAGKSTLVRTINLLQKPRSGEIVIGSKSIFKATPVLDASQDEQRQDEQGQEAETGFPKFLQNVFRRANEEIDGGRDSERERLRKLRLGIGMIFQHFNLIQSKTVFDNVAFAMKAAGKKEDEIRERVTELLNLVGLADKHHVYPGNLSGGQKQRVGIARALANNPRILLCDEPTSALDLETTQSILELLKNINKAYGITIVVITHEMDVVKAICDRVAVMSRGKVVEQGNAYDIFARPQHELTKQLVQHTMNMQLPPQLFMNIEGKILKIVYQGEEAVEPVISDASKKYDVRIAILHGKIEYIGNQPIGVLVVNVKGHSPEVERAVTYIGENSAYTEVLYA